MLNEVKLIGRVGQNPEIRMTQTGSKIFTFTLATEEVFEKNGKKNKITDWHNITYYNPPKFLEDNVGKGMLLYVSGSLKNNVYENDGKKISKIFVLAHRVLLLSQPETKKFVENNREVLDEIEKEDIPF